MKAIHKLFGKIFLVLLLSLGLNACHEDDEDNATGDGSSTQTRTYQGRFIDESVENLFYEILTNGLVERSARTDAQGHFLYPQDRAFQVRFFLGDDSQNATARLQFNTMSFSVEDAADDGLIVSPDLLYPDNPELALGIARFLQAADISSSFGIRLDELLHMEVAEDPRFAEAQQAVQPTSDLLEDYSDILDTLQYTDIPEPEEARRRMDAALICEVCGIWSIESANSTLNGTFALSADSSARGTVYDRSDIGYSLSGKMQPRAPRMLFLQPQIEAPLPPWSGEFNARFDRISTENRNFSPRISAELISFDGSATEWKLATALPGTTTLLFLHMSDETLSGFFYTGEQTQYMIDGDYNAEDRTFSAPEQGILSGTIQSPASATQSLSTAEFRVVRNAYEEELSAIPICRP